MNPNPYLQGQNCSVCGQWVPFGTFHSCNIIPGSTNTPTQLQQQFSYLPYWTLLERIAVALEKIAQKLEAK